MDLPLIVVLVMFWCWFAWSIARTSRALQASKLASELYMAYAADPPAWVHRQYDRLQVPTTTGFGLLLLAVIVNVIILRSNARRYLRAVAAAA